MSCRGAIGDVRKTRASRFFGSIAAPVLLYATAVLRNVGICTLRWIHLEVDMSNTPSIQCGRLLAMRAGWV